MVHDLTLKLMGHRLHQLNKTKIIRPEANLPVQVNQNGFMGGRVTNCSVGRKTDCWPSSTVLFQTLFKSLSCQATKSLCSSSPNLRNTCQKTMTMKEFYTGSCHLPRHRNKAANSREMRQQLF